MASKLVLLCLSALASAHTAAWADGMYCRNGTVPGVDDQNTNTAVNPLYMLPKEEWWFQADRNCTNFPPLEGEFLNIPAGGNFTVELAHNRAQTTLSYDGKFTSPWPDGKQHPADWEGDNDGCLSDGAMHTRNFSDAAGTAFAIAYKSGIGDVTIEDLVVFSVHYNSPWMRETTYEVPKELPACPPDGCMCAWLWVPDGCGTPNMYMQGFRCKVTGATSTVPVGPAKPPVYCDGQPSKCVKGPKQMIVFNQLTGNNIQVPSNANPAYNQKCGFADGAQNDIFGPSSSESNTTVASPVDTASSKTSVEPRAKSSGLADPVLLANTPTPANASIPVSIPTGDVVPTTASYAHGDNCHAKSHSSVKPHAKSSGLADPVLLAKSSGLADPVLLANTATPASTSIPVSIPTGDVVPPNDDGIPASSPTAASYAHGDNCNHNATKSHTRHVKSSVLADPVFQVNTATPTSTSASTPVTNAADVVVPPNNGTLVTNPTATLNAHGDGCDHDVAKPNTLMTSFKPSAKSSDLADPVFQVNTAVSTSTPGSTPSAVKPQGY